MRPDVRGYLVLRTHVSGKKEEKEGKNWMGDTLEGALSFVTPFTNVCGEYIIIIELATSQPSEEEWLCKENLIPN